MRLLERNPRLSGLVVGLAVLALAGVRAQAQPEITSTEPGSIVVYPKVISDGTRDTILSLTNTTNMMAYVHCEATNGIGQCRNSPDPANQIYYCNSDEECLNVTAPDGSELANVGPCDLSCQPLDYGFTLTAHQPTFWRVSTGRVQDPTLMAGNTCTPAGNSQICPGFFLLGVEPGQQDPGSAVPGMENFRGEVRCFQVDQSGALVTGNALKGEAFIETLGTGTIGAGGGIISGYNSINVQGQGSPASENTANLDGDEYARCPAGLTIDHLAPGAADPISGAPTDVELTFVPCSYNTASSTFFRVQFFTYDQMEFFQSGGDVRGCWANYLGSQTGGMFGRGTTYLRSTAAATNTGNCSGGNPAGFPCTSDSDCGNGGFCGGAVANQCDIGDATGFVCAFDSDCGTGGVCGPPTGVLGVAEQFYGDEVQGTSAEVAHWTGIRTTNDVMSFTGGF